jgi:uncharacterized protein
VPEVFRRAMEEEGWFDDGGRRSGNPGGPGCAGRASLFLIALVLGGLFLSLNWIVTTYTEWLWFGELGYQNVWLTQWGVQIVSFLVFFVVAAVFLLANWHLARRIASRTSPVLIPQPLALRPVGWLITGLALFMAFMFASAGSSEWEGLLRFIYRVPFNLAEPIFARDVSFYIYELPVFQLIRNWIMFLLFVALAGVIALHAVANWQAVQESDWRPFGLPAFRVHAALLGALFLGLWAAGYWLESYELLFSPQGFVYGVGYTDANATLLALRVQMVLMALVAVAVAINIVRLNWKVPAAATALWFVASFLVGNVYPGIVQRYQVEPNELARESPYIAHNIDFTRRAFGLDEVEVRPFAGVGTLQQQDLVANDAVLQNIRLWDYRLLHQSYQQLQALRPYYEFSSVDIDRYEIDGITRQVMLAARELNKANLPAQSWVNRKLEFTHGYGIVMNPVDRFTTEGRPEFFIQDLPPQSNVDIEVTRPEVYYGERTTDEVYVASGLAEFSYPRGDENVYQSYEGDGGVPISNFLRRVAFALRFGDTNLFLSEYVNSDTRVMFHRQIRDRVQRITPFLLLDRDPYIVVAEGRLVWMLDTYTVSRNFPYSTPAPQGLNYIRNAAKVTIDAYDGKVTYYVSAPDDPLIQTYARAFPDLFQPLEAMPESLQAHIRYPEDLFLIQTNQYLAYHMTDVQMFYNQEDLWEIPMEIFEGSQQPIEPYYVVFVLPGESEPEFLLIQPFTPSRKNNMVAWIAARNDVPNYGQLVAYELPRQELVFGPIQIEGRIDQDGDISQQITLWSQRGSRVIRGNLIVIPIGNSFLYVEPLFLMSETSAMPELRRVIVATGDRIVMRPTLDGALAALVEGAPSVDAIVADPPVEGVELPDAAVVPVQPTAPDATVEELVRSANSRFEAAQAAQRDGDWGRYGQELQALQQDLERLLQLTGGEFLLEEPTGALPEEPAPTGD